MNKLLTMGALMALVMTVAGASTLPQWLDQRTEQQDFVNVLVAQGMTPVDFDAYLNRECLSVQTSIQYTYGPRYVATENRLPGTYSFRCYYATTYPCASWRGRTYYCSSVGTWWNGGYTTDGGIVNTATIADGASSTYFDYAHSQFVNPFWT